MSTSKKNYTEDDVQSPERRKLLKKAAYVAPSLMILGIMTPISKGYAASTPNSGGGENPCNSGGGWGWGWGWWHDNGNCTPDPGGDPGGNPGW